MVDIIAGLSTSLGVHNFARPCADGQPCNHPQALSWLGSSATAVYGFAVIMLVSGFIPIRKRAPLEGPLQKDATSLGLIIEVVFPECGSQFPEIPFFGH